ncbi:helix-turn-helix transcriptional regulator [Massilia consociata]|uniref:Helix-turn-helix transcriptional regulator n=1 Tax=Massilia consociata TaxID=760117 RepID=A0ABV6FL09_9BURK
MSRKKNSRQWARLRILCSGGLHLMTLIPDALALVRELIPNSASQLFLHAERAPEDSIEAKVLGVLPPPNGYFYGDAAAFTGLHPAQLRAQALHVLEVRLGPASSPFGTLTLLRNEGPSFDTEDAEDLGRVANYFDHALRNAVGHGLSGMIEDEAMLLATTDGDILFLSDSAGALLDQLASQEQQVFDRRMLPPFCLRLVESVVYGERYPWRLPAGALELAGGVLEARAQWMSAGSCAAIHSRTVGIFLKFVVPMPLRIWRALGSVELSPQQMEVAFWMGVGGGREAARSRMDVSDAVLRDCVKAVYEKLGCTSEAGLLAILRPPVSRL